MGNISGRINQYQQQAQQQPGSQMWGPPAAQQPAYQNAMQSTQLAQQRPQRPGMGSAQAPAYATDQSAGLYGQAGRGQQMQGYLGQLQQARGPMGPVGTDQTPGVYGQAGRGEQMQGYLGALQQQRAQEAAQPGVYGQAGRGQQMQGLVSQLQGAMQNPQVQQAVAQYGPQLAQLAQQFGGLNLGALNQMRQQVPAAAAPPPMMLGQIQQPMDVGAPGFGPAQPWWTQAQAPSQEQLAAERGWGAGVAPGQGLGAVVPGSIGTRQSFAPVPARDDLQARLGAMYGQLGRVPRM